MIHLSNECVDKHTRKFITAQGEFFAAYYTSVTKCDLAQLNNVPVCLVDLSLAKKLYFLSSHLISDKAITLWMATILFLASSPLIPYTRS